jgi:hypothetical protein
MGLFNFNNKHDQVNIDLNNLKFESPDHKRFENGIHVSGPHPNGARRGIEVKKNPRAKGYLVTMHNLDGIHPVWGNNIQMAEKQMEVISSTDSKTVLRGWGDDPRAFGHPSGSFANYGITIHHPNGKINKIILHMHDRKVDIEYMKYV